jgi:arabinofuranosyltransferase
MERTDSGEPSPPRPSSPSLTPARRARRETEKNAAILLVLCVWIVLLTVISLKIAGQALDDMFITYRYAHNLQTGHGLTFNPGERVFGLSDPGVAMLLAGGAAITGLTIPAVGTVVTAAALLVIAGAVLWEAGKRGRFSEAAAGGTLVVTSSYLWLGQGSGPLVALALLALAALLAERHPAIAGAVGGVAVWCRPDALIGCAILGWLIVRRQRRPPIAFAAGAAAVCGIGLCAAWAYFGRLLPATLDAKQQFAARNLAAFTGLQGFWGRALDLFQWAEGGWAQILIPIGVLGSLHLYRSTGFAGRLLLAYGGTLALAYTLLRIPFSIWYVGPTAAWLFMSSGFAIAGAARFLARRAGRTAAAAVVLIALLALGWPVATARAGWLREGFAADWRRAAYQAAGEWLARNTPPDADVAFNEVGIVGFYSERPMLDLIGLVSPSSIPYTAAGDQIGAFLAKPTRYLLLHTHDPRGGTGPIVSRPWFRHSYRERVRLHLPKFGVSMVIFERRPHRRVPPPRPPQDRRKLRSSATISSTRPRWPPAPIPASASSTSDGVADDGKGRFFLRIGQRF